MRCSSRAKPQEGQNTLHLEVQPQGLIGTRGFGFELVLDPVVPQMAEQLVEVVDIPVHSGVGLRGGLHGPGPGQGVEYISPAPAVFISSTPFVEYLAPEEIYRFPAPEPVVESIAPVPPMIPAPEPVLESVAPVPAVIPSPAPVVEYTSLVPAPAEEYISLTPAGFHGPTAFLRSSFFSWICWV